MPQTKPTLFDDLVAGRLLDIDQLAARLGVHRNTLLRWRKAGRMPQPINFTNRYRWRVSTIEAWAEAGFSHDWKEPEA